MAALRTLSRVLSLASDVTLNRADSNIVRLEPDSGSLARGKGSFFVVTETQGDTAEERAFCRLVAEAIRVEYLRGGEDRVDQALGMAVERGNTRVLADERLPPEAERPVVAVTCLAVRDGELAVAQTLPVQTYIGTRDGVALIPDPPFWESDGADLTPDFFIGFGPRLRYHLYTASLGPDDLIAVCSSALAQSLTIERLERWLTSGDVRQVTQGLRANYARVDIEPAYALVVQVQPDVREAARLAPSAGDRHSRRPLLPFPLALPTWTRTRARGGPSARDARDPGDTVPGGARRGGGGGRSAGAPAVRPVGRAPIAVASVLLVLILVFLTVKGVQRVGASRERAAYGEVSGQVDALLSQAGQAQDPTAAAGMLQQAQAVVDRNAGRLNATDRQDLQGRVQQRQDQLVKASRFAQVKVLADLSSDRQASFAQIVLQGDNLFVLDTGGRRILKLTTTGGTAAIPALVANTTVGQDVVQVPGVLTALANGFLAVDSRNAVWSFNPATNQARRVAVPGAEMWGEARALTTYRNELYVLDTKLNHVWRYSPQGDGFGPPVDYFASVAPPLAATPEATQPPRRLTPTPAATPTPVPTPTPPDLRHSVDLSVDGSVYLLQADGSIVKYTNGLPDPFPETGLVGKMPTPSRVIALPEDSSIYVVDPSGKRLVRFTKAGVFQRQYLLPPDAPASLTGLRSAAVDRAHNLVYLLGDKAVGVAALPNQ